MKEKNYGIFNINFLDNIIKNKRSEMLNILSKNINNKNLMSFLDIGTTEDNELESSNFFLKKFKQISIKKSISDQNINNKNFNNVLKKSITSTFIDHEVDIYKSDLVISSATIEHVGNYENQFKMLENIMQLTSKYFFITTPNRFFPIEMHTKIPLIHFFPKKIHRKILYLIGEKYLSLEENLNLLTKKDLLRMCKILSIKNFKIKEIKLFGFVSNYILIIEKN